MVYTIVSLTLLMDRVQQKNYLSHFSVGKRPECKPYNSSVPYEFYNNEPEFEVIHKMGTQGKRLVDFDKKFAHLKHNIWHGRLNEKERKREPLKFGVKAKAALDARPNYNSKLIDFDQVVFEPWKHRGECFFT
ncbi:hypothetical protein HDU99_010403 [Rhizoclosmatium hyalinum]|nr:hypothetical protein HDU99_010403 [Rhizoclosmatium hyalinum]